MSIWLVRAGSQGKQEQIALDKNLVTIHWNELPDLSNITTREALTDLYRQHHANESQKSLTIQVGQVWAFRERMKEGDLAVLPLHIQSGIAIGRITGPYKYRTDLGSEVLHTRSVEWIRKDFPRTTFDQDILNSFGALMTVCHITRNNAEERIEAVLAGKAMPSLGKVATDEARAGSNIAHGTIGYSSATISFLKELPKRTSDAVWHTQNKQQYKHVLRDPSRKLVRQVREKYIARLSQEVAGCRRQLSVLTKNDYGKGGYHSHYWFAFYDPNAHTKTHSSQLFFIMFGTEELCRYGFSLGYYSRQYLQRLRQAIQVDPLAVVKYLSVAPSGTAVEIKINGNACRWTVGDWANLLQTDLAKATGSESKDAQISIFQEFSLDALVAHDTTLADEVGNYFVWAWPFFDASITGKWPTPHKVLPEHSLPEGVDVSKTPADLTVATTVPHPTMPRKGPEPTTTLALKEKEPNMYNKITEEIKQVPILTVQEIETKKVNINKLFTDFWFRVPEYQRSYKWGSEELDELLEDIRHAQQTAKDKEYFLGSVVLQKHLRSQGSLEYYCYDVLDGQQRLTTLLIMMAVLRDLATDAKLKARAAEAIYQEQNAYENQPERVRIEFFIRDEVRDFVETFLKPEFGTGQQDLLEQKRGLPNVSISNMAKATLYLRKKLGDLPQEELNRLAVFLFNKVIVIYVAAESLEDAFRLFTILNNRGFPLTNSDILKSMNIGAVEPQQKRQHYAKLWEEQEGQFGPDEFDRFLGHLRTIVVKEKARENLLKEFEKLYKDGKLEKGENTLRMVKTYRDHYASLIWFENEILDGDCRFRNLIAVMKEDLSTDWIPPLLYFAERFGRQLAFFFLTRLESKFLADWILQQSPTTRISAMNAILRAVEDAKTAEDVISNDKLFEYDREHVCQAINGPIYGRSFGRYLMLRVEYHLMDRSQLFATFNRISVEHVLPQQPKEDSKWSADFTLDDRTYWTDRIANLVLLSRIKNSELSNRDFTEKKQNYFKSSVSVFPNVVQVMQQADWTPAILEKRQKQLVTMLMEQFK